ncbi:MAG TPA: histidine phosphatase family protein [Vicinamibacterales bacterium]|jgi:probable phosphoglycerate mutase|nr:histidine phosphatase family protein [Vicinamibacterales bacterium]
MPSQRVCLIRHGETEWTLNGRHTGTTDIPLTENGRRVARQWNPVLRRYTFELVLTSPMQRARETCELAGLGDQAEVDCDLKEWNYGEYEGLTPEQIYARRPTWMIFTDGCPGGESPTQVQERLDRVIARVRGVRGNVALFAHGHFLRSFGARWLGFRAEEGRLFVLEPATVSVMGYYRDVPAVLGWNAPFIS